MIRRWLAALILAAGFFSHEALADAIGGTSQGVTSAALDALLCGTQGGIAYRNATSWVCLTPGTSGLPLLTQGAAANPIFGTIATGAVTSAQGNGTKFQLSTGSTTTGHCAEFDGNGNTIDNGSTCGSSGGGGTLNYSDNGVTLTANTYFIPPGGGGIPQTTEANVDVAAPAAATISALQVGISVAPGAGNSYTITFRDAGADTALTCSISGASATTCQDITHSVNIAKGDPIDWKLVSAGTIITTPTVTIAAANGTSGVGVTSIATTSPITGGTITTTGTIACATCVTSAASLTSNQLMIGAGSQASQTLGSLGTTTTLLHGNAGGAPSFGAVSLTADVSGLLPAANAPAASNAALGYAQCDGTTLTCASGIASAASGIQVVSVALSSAQLKLCNTTPTLLLSAPGAGKVHILVNAVAELIYGTITYTAGSTAQIVYGPAASGSASGTTTVFTAGASAIQVMVPASAVTLQSNSANLGLYFGCLGTNLATGDGTGVITIRYYTLTL